MLSFRVEGLPPSYNSSMKINYNFREVSLSLEARVFKQRVKMCMPYADFTTANTYKVEIEYHGNFKYKNGKNRRLDLQNMDKLLIDAIFDKLGADDSYLWQLQECKIQDDNDYTVVNIHPL